MAARPPRARPERRRKARRGSLERPVSGRIYRATWALVALPLLVTAFTVGRPAALPAPALPPTFDGSTAARLTAELARRFPIRAPGTDGGAAATEWVREHLEDYNLSVEEQAFEATIPGRGRVRLVNLVAGPFRIGPELPPGTIVVMAHRDNSGLSAGLDDNASGTAALIELARSLSTVSANHTVVFVSTDGGAFGSLGAAALAADERFTRDVVAVVDLDSIASPGLPHLAIAGDRPSSPSGELLATADGAILAETGVRAGHPDAFAQLLDLAFPFSLYDNAPFLGRGVSALTLTAAGDRPPRPSADTATTLDEASAERLSQLGRAAQTVVLSLDGAAELAQGTGPTVYLGGRVVRGAAIAFLLVVAMLPALAATLDLAVRLRRRGISFAPALRSLRSRLAVWGFAGLMAAVFALTGVFPRGASRPLSPDLEPAQHWPLWALLGLGVIVLLGWLAARPRLLPRGPVTREDELAGHLVAMLLLTAVALFLAIANPFALLLVLPSLHAWLWLPHLLDRPLWLRLVCYAVGLSGPIGLLVSFAVRFDLGFDAPWYLGALFSVGYAPLTLFLGFLVWGAAAGQLGAVAAHRYAPYADYVERPALGALRLVAAHALRPLERPVRAGSGERQEVDARPGGDIAVSAGDVHEGVGVRGSDDHV